MNDLLIDMPPPDYIPEMELKTILKELTNESIDILLHHAKQLRLDDKIIKRRKEELRSIAVTTILPNKK